MATAGRTVLFSALTVGLSMLALALFPMYFLRSFAFAGIAVVALTALAALVIAPAAIVVLGDRIDALDLRPLARRMVRRPPPQRLEDGFWYRTARFAIRHAAVVAVAVTVLLLILGAPFTHVKWGFPDERMLPTSASARQLGDRLRTDFGYNPDTAMTIVVPDLSGAGDRRDGPLRARPLRHRTRRLRLRAHRHLRRGLTGWGHRPHRPGWPTAARS